MPKKLFPIDRANLDWSAAEAFRAHTNGELGYEEWKATATRIGQLKSIESFRQQHSKALYDNDHKEHWDRVAELEKMYEAAHPEGSNDPR